MDENTVALYHLDSANGLVVDDAKGLRNGTLFGGAVIAPGLYSDNLQLTGVGSYVEAGDFGDWNATQGTIEAFVDFGANGEACNTPSGGFFGIMSAGSGYGTNTDIFRLRVAVGLQAGILTNNGWVWVDSGINPCRYLSSAEGAATNLAYWGAPVIWPYETWRFHHIAVTWGPRGMEIWVDGVLHGLGNTYQYAGQYPYPYMCNPQDQVGYPDHPNPYYPKCPRPGMIVPPGPYPPGDYTGALAPFTKLLIGCDSDGSCFKGRIDEVRVSNIQRTLDWTVDPPSSPTPTQTPVTITGPYSVDPSTVALYHLEYANPSGSMSQVFNEADGQYDSSFWTNAAIVSNGRFGSGFSISGDVTNGFWPQLTMNPGNYSSGTFETWVKLDNTSGNFTLFKGSSSETNGLQPRVRLGTHAPNGNVGFAIDNGQYWMWIDSKAVPEDFVGSWHHVAGTWGQRGMELWIDGELCVRGSYSGWTLAPIAQYGIGCNPDGVCIRGTLDEVRISSLQRTFSPAGLAIPVRMAGSNQAAIGGSSNSVFLPFISLAPTPARVPCSPM